MVLKLDGTFEQRYVSKSAENPLINGGKWWLDQGKAGRLALEHKMFVNDAPQNEILSPPRYGSTILHIRMIAGVIELVVSSDASLYYQKITLDRL